MASDRVTALAADLWLELGYDGCRDLREALRQQMADHRANVAAWRRAAGLARPRSTRRPTSAALAAAVAGGTSESSTYRAKVVEHYAPHLAQEVTAGRMKLWAAYRQAVKVRDAAAVAVVTGSP